FTLLHEAVEKGIPAEKVADIVDIIKRTFFELGDAEALEFQFRGRMDVTPEEYLRVVRKKAADVEAHTRISAILGGGTKDEIENLGSYGRLLGMLIILGDDITDTFDMKELRHRIKREHLPLPVLYALQNTQTKPLLSPILKKERLSKKDAEKIFEITQKAGGFKRSSELMQEMANDTYRYTKDLKLNRENLILLTRAMLPSLST
ncbi:MAG: polyprenyl synthetase family protein, partial [Candidatus Hydrothermarchaeota archaeon]